MFQIFRSVILVADLNFNNFSCQGLLVSIEFNDVNAGLKVCEVDSVVWGLGLRY
jgi:hypothetical protein